MDQAFGWIGGIFQTLLKVIPWLVIVPATHGGVAFVRGSRIKEWKPGLHWYWPVVTTYRLMAMMRQTQLIQSKIVMTRDLRTVMVGGLVTYIIEDVVPALAKIVDLPSDIMERTQGALLSAVAEMTMEEIQGDRPGFNRILSERVTEVMNGYGVQILHAQITEFAPCTAFAINGHAAVGNYQLWTGF